jgi:hypoxanthine phosphoribosyltransferase
MVVSDFMKQYTKPCEVSKMAFMKELFYKWSEAINWLEPRFDWAFVVILEDIVDTGNTLVELKELFKAQNVKHFKILFSLNRKRTKGHQDWLCWIRIPDKFIVGFGLDYW